MDPHRLTQLLLHVLGKKQLDPPLRPEETQTVDKLREEIGDVESKGYTLHVPTDTHEHQELPT